MTVSLKSDTCFAGFGYGGMVCDEDESFACTVLAQVFY